MSEMFAFFPWDKINTDLKAESSKNIEVGYKKFLDYGLYSFALFNYDIKNKIVQNNGQSINLDKATHKGAEFRYENLYLNKHHFKFSYSYTIAKDADKNDLELIPKHKVIIEDKIKLNNIYSTNIQYIYVGDRVDNTNNNGTMKLSSYSLTNLYLNAKFTQHWNGTIGVKNIFDKNYYSSYGYPNEGRNIYGQISWRF